MKSILVIGCGAMGGAMVRGWLRAIEHNQLPLGKIFVLTRTGQYPQTIPTSNIVHLLKGPQELTKIHVDLVLLGLKPQKLREYLSSQQLSFPKSTVIATIAAGLDFNFYQQFFPESPLLRVMPNLPVSTGFGFTGLMESNLDRVQKESASTLFKGLGEISWVVDEDRFNRLTAMTGCGPGFFFRICEAMVKAGVQMGFSHEESELMTNAVLNGSSHYLQERNIACGELWREVASPAGMTQAGLDQLDKNIDRTLRDAVEAAYLRGDALNRQCKT